MGIKELWPFLNPYCERKPLFELQGKIVAIDLAGWICESLCVVDYEVQAKFYLRNLFFRTCFLLLSGITPVFVLEGKAPVLKHQLIAKRNKIQFRGAKPRDQNETNDLQAQSMQQKPSKGRTRFNYVLRQCEELIRSMGLQCMQGPGEAEAFCAHLNANGFVDGVISQDSDCFAYGARRVFRNFTLSMQGSAGSIGGSVDIYDLNVVEKSVDFGRNKVIVMALLCGCDYCPEGVGGVGKDAVQKLFSIYTENEILDKIRSWRSNDNKFTELEIKVNDNIFCTSCGHYGRVRSHTKNGCASCKMHVGCDSSVWKYKRLAIKTELQIRKKAMLNEDFPSEDIIDEFMQKSNDTNVTDIEWCQPNMIKFIRMMGSTLQWNEIYCFQKFLPLLTRWQLHHLGSESDYSLSHGFVEPDMIKKKRAPKGVPSYEIIWKDSHKIFLGLIPDNQIENYYSTSKSKDIHEAEQMLWCTIEPADLVEKAYPDLVERFLQSKLKIKAKKNKLEECISVPTKETKLRLYNENTDRDSNTIEGKPDLKNNLKKNMKSKKSLKSKKIEKFHTMDAFLRKEDLNESKVYQSPEVRTSSKPMNLSVFASENTDSLMSMNDSKMDLSNIIDEIVARTPPITEVIGKRLRFDEIHMGPNNDANEYNQNIDENKENEMNLIRNEEMEESFDDFDRLVMHKSSNGHLGKVTNSKNHQCSTPIFKRKNDDPIGINAKIEDICVTPVLDKTTIKKKTKLFSSFFNVNLNDEVDLFEKSVDFRNMEEFL